MKTTRTTLLPSALLLFGYVDDCILLTLHKIKNTDHSNSSSRVKLRVKEGMSVGNLYSATKNIEIKHSKGAI
jgi:hypothetical protein